MARIWMNTTKKGRNQLITIKTQLEIAAPIQLCFDLARDIDLHTRTVWPHTKEKEIRRTTSGLIGKGESVTFQATHFLIRQTLSSKITEYHAPYYFVDEMQNGAFKELKHIHEFKDMQGKTVMIDTLHFRAPFGPIGWLVERIILKSYMKKFIEHRNGQLKEIAEEQTKAVR